MQRRFVALVAVVAVLALPALASAAVTITAGSANIIQGQSAVVDVVITSTAGEGLNAVDLSFLLAGPGSPMVTALNLNGPGTLFSQNASNLFPAGPPYDPPTNEQLFGSVANVAAVNSLIGASSILAQLTFSTAGVNVGSYNYGLGNGDWENSFQATTGPLDPTLIGGTINVLPVPEPSSIVLGLFAAAGMAAMVVRRRRSA